jgi:ABC-type phosphate transport system substrate-binding protein
MQKSSPAIRPVLRLRCWIPLVIFAAAARSSEPEAPVIIAASPDAAPIVERILAAFEENGSPMTASVRTAPHRERVQMLRSGEAALIAAFRRPEYEDILRVERARQAPLEVLPFAAGAVVLAAPPARPNLVLTLEDVRGLLTGKITTWPQLHAEGDEIELLVAGDESDCLAVVQQRLFPRQAWTRRFQPQADRVSVLHGLTLRDGRLAVVRAGPLGDVQPVPIRTTIATAAVTASAETIRNRSYPLAHYVSWWFAGEPDGAARSLILFSLSPTGQKTLQDGSTGGFPLPLRE